MSGKNGNNHLLPTWKKEERSRNGTWTFRLTTVPVVSNRAKDRPKVAFDEEHKLFSKK